MKQGLELVLLQFTILKFILASSHVKNKIQNFITLLAATSSFDVSCLNGHQHVQRDNTK